MTLSPWRATAMLVLAAASGTARADTFDRLVGYTCDAAANQLVIHYRGAWNEKGQAMLKDKGTRSWSPGELIASMRDDDHIGSLRTIRRRCVLKGATYDIRLGPTPGNFNIQGRCGANVTAWAEVRVGQVRVLPRRELEGDCHDDKAPVTTRILLRPGAPGPVIDTVLPEEFLRE